MIKVEVKVWENKEFGLTYVENRAFTTQGNEEMVDAYLSVVTSEDGCDFDLSTMFEEEQTETTVDDIVWTLVEKMVDNKVPYDNYQDYFITGYDYINKK